MSRTEWTGSSWDWATHRIVAEGGLFVVYQQSTDGELTRLASATTLAQAEKLLIALKNPGWSPKKERPRRVAETPPDELGQDNLVRGVLSGPYLMPRGGA